MISDSICFHVIVDYCWKLDLWWYIDRVWFTRKSLVRFNVWKNAWLAILKKKIMQIYSGSGMNKSCKGGSVRYVWRMLRIRNVAVEGARWNRQNPSHFLLIWDNEGSEIGSIVAHKQWEWEPGFMPSNKSYILVTLCKCKN